MRERLIAVRMCVRSISARPLIELYSITCKCPSKLSIINICLNCRINRAVIKNTLLPITKAFNTSECSHRHQQPPSSYRQPTPPHPLTFDATQCQTTVNNHHSVMVVIFMFAFKELSLSLCECKCLRVCLVGVCSCVLKHVKATR